jgi:small subunit ribosomal protein S6
LRNYELVLIIHPETEETAFKEMVDRVKGWITDSGGQVSKVDLWGKRQLAYPIHKQKEGLYALLQSQMETSYCIELERNLRLQESILRFLLVAQET